MMLDYEIGLPPKPKCSKCNKDAAVGDGTGSGDADNHYLGPLLCNEHR